MSLDVKTLTLVGLADAKAWLKIFSSSVVSNSSVNGATVSDGTGFRANQAITWIDSTGVVKGRSFIATVAGNAITWAPAFGQAPAVGDLITDGGRDDQIIRFLDSLSQNLENSTGRIFKARTVTEQFTGDLTTLFITDARPIISITSLMIDGVAYDSTKYVMDSDMGIIRLQPGYIFPNTTAGNCVLTYVAGFDGTANFPIPDDAVLLVLQLLKQAYDGWQTGGASASTLHTGNSALTMLKAMPDSLRDLYNSLVDQRKMFMSKRL